jgi:diguanylate cyclase
VPHHHLSLFPLLASAVAVFGAWTALDLFRRVRQHVGSARLVWTAAAAAALGVAIWSMHFIAMLGFDPGSPVRYDPGLTALSLVLAVGGTLGAFLFAAHERASAPRLVASGVAMGAAICAMHYVGMAALRTAASLGYRPELVVLSLLIAVGASITALFAARRESSLVWRTAAAALLGGAIVGMHYTAMAALELTLEAGHPVSGAPPVALAVAVAAGSITVLFLALAASLQDQRLNVLSALEAGAVGYWELTVPARRFSMSDTAKRVLGEPLDQPFSQEAFQRRLPAEQQAERRRMLEAALAGEIDYEMEYHLADVDRWVQVRGRMVRSRSGRPLRLAGIVSDVTDRHRAFHDLAESERRQRLLINELNHRVKNTLATVQSIAVQTARRSADLDSFLPVFEARLVALSNTQNVLTAGAWERAGLRALLEQELRPYAVEQVRLHGPEVELDPGQALAMGLVLHEMATNAAKYGALSTGAGCVEIDWRLDEADRARRLVLDWTEKEGPTVSEPTASGFGTRLIRTSLERTLGGSAQFTYAPDGLQARLELPLRSPPTSGSDA